jgi:hypothetical protein
MPKAGSAGRKTPRTGGTAVAAREEPKVCRLSAGGKWIRTIGTWKISFRFETDFRRIRDDSGFRTSSISTCARMPPHMPAEARGEESCGFVEPASAERPNRASERAASEGRRRAASPLINRSPFGPHNARNSRCRPRRADTSPHRAAGSPGRGHWHQGRCRNFRCALRRTRGARRAPRAVSRAARSCSTVDEPSGDVFEGLVDIAVQQLETETLRSGLFQGDASPPPVISRCPASKLQHSVTRPTGPAIGRGLML